MKKRVLLLLPTHTYRTTAFLEAAAKMNIELSVGSERKQALADLAPGATTVVDIYRHHKAVKQIAEFTALYPLDAVIGVDENTVNLAAKAAHLLGLPHNDLAGVAAAADKFKMRRMLAGGGMLSPEYACYSLHDDPRRFSLRQSYPVVLKPLLLSAGRGVIRANNKTEFCAAWESIRSICNDKKLRRRGGRSAEKILIEKYIPGEEVALEGLVNNGRLHTLAVFDKPDPLVGPYFAETIYVTPSRHSEQIQAVCVETVRKAIAVMGIGNGPVHAEMRINEMGVWLVEIANRSIGGLCSQVLQFENGMRLEEIILRQATGMLDSVPQRERRAAGVLMIPVEKSGTLVSVTGADQAAEVAGVEEVIISIGNGQEVQSLPQGNRYLGFVFARGKYADEVEKSLRSARSRLNILIEENPDRITPTQKTFLKHV